jgi:hypothetical protein
MSTLPTGFISRGNLPPREIRKTTNLILLLEDGRQVHGWYDSTGLWYAIGQTMFVDSDVIAWRVQGDAA